MNAAMQLRPASEIPHPMWICLERSLKERARLAVTTVGHANTGTWSGRSQRRSCEGCQHRAAVPNYLTGYYSGLSVILGALLRGAVLQNVST